MSVRLLDLYLFKGIGDYASLDIGRIQDLPAFTTSILYAQRKGRGPDNARTNSRFIHPNISPGFTVLGVLRNPPPGILQREILKY